MFRHSHQHHFDALARLVLGADLKELHMDWDCRPYWMDLIGLVAGHQLTGPCGTPLSLSQAVHAYVMYYV